MCDRSILAPRIQSMVGKAEIVAVVEDRRSGWLTVGPRVAAFVRELREPC